MKNARRISEYERFMSLSDEDKNREVAVYDRELPHGRSLTAAEKALHKKAAKMGRPRVGNGAKMIALTVEMGLLKRADAWAKRQGISPTSAVRP